VFTDLGASVQQIQCLGQLSFTLTLLLYMVAPLAAFLIVPIIVRVLLGITSRLGIFAAGEPSGKLWIDPLILPAFCCSL